jgi:LytR_cpsA_psr family
MTRKTRKQVAVYSVYALLAAGIVGRLFSILAPSFGWSVPGGDDNWLVSVTGNVMRPGQYRVPAGTTPFEILKVAGIRPTSDISGFDLTRQITNNQQLRVGTMPNPVTIKRQPDKIRLEFHTGSVSVNAAGGQTRTLENGMDIRQGDRILTSDKSQAELSASSFSRIDLDNASEIAFDKIGSVENGKTITWPLQKSGVVWYKIVYGSANELFRITTSLVNITVAGSGADFTVAVKPDEIDVNAMDGQVLVERANGTEAINLVAGQGAVVFGDGRPFQVSPMSQEMYPTARFSVLTKEKSTAMQRAAPFTFVFCGIPSVYYFGSADYETGTFTVVNFPPDLDVQEFVQGCATLSQAFLYGGGLYVSLIAEQVLDTRVPKQAVLEKNDMIRIAATLGGVTVDVDEKAAAELNVKKGKQKLSGVQVAQFLRPGLSTTVDFKDRQTRVLKALFEGVSSRNIVLTALLSKELVAMVKTNISAAEIMDQYSKFASVQHWTFKQYSLPVKQTYHAGRGSLDPILEECRALLQKG